MNFTSMTDRLRELTSSEQRGEGDSGASQRVSSSGETRHLLSKRGTIRG
jgi:hypothetical protein